MLNYKALFLKWLFWPQVTLETHNSVNFKATDFVLVSNSRSLTDKYHVIIIKKTVQPELCTILSEHYTILCVCGCEWIYYVYPQWKSWEKPLRLFEFGCFLVVHWCILLYYFPFLYIVVLFREVFRCVKMNTVNGNNGYSVILLSYTVFPCKSTSRKIKPSVLIWGLLRSWVIQCLVHKNRSKKKISQRNNIPFACMNAYFLCLSYRGCVDNWKLLTNI